MDKYKRKRSRWIVNVLCLVLGVCGILVLVAGLTVDFFGFMSY